MHERLATGEDDPFDMHVSNARELVVKLLQSYCIVADIFPDVAHHTAAIALTVDVEQQNGKRCNPRST